MTNLLLKIYILISILNVPVSNAAKILTVAPTPSISHQVVFRTLTQELVRRGHDVTIITTDPAFPKGEAPANLTEIDVHDESYKIWRDMITKNHLISGSRDDLLIQIRVIHPMISYIFEKQMQTPEIQKILWNGTFDLLIIETWVRPTLVFSHAFKNIPVISVSSLGGTLNAYDMVGAPSRPLLLYPLHYQQRTVNLTLWEKVVELYNHYKYESIMRNQDEEDNKLVKNILGPDTPTIKELEKNVDLLFLSMHEMWALNRPVPPSLVYMGGIHQKESKNLPLELKEFLDSSKHGVIYISFGTNAMPSALPPERIQILVKVFSQLSYDVLWKWDKNKLPGQSKNIRISKWLPQSDLLKHPKIKLFITQGGLQSTDEAITAKVPLIGMPMLADQWYNVEQYVYHKIGVRVDFDRVTEEVFKNAINTVIGDSSYRKNIERLRSLMRDQPESGLQRAVWWTEHVLRHGGARHLRAPAANISWAEYLDLQLLAALALGLISIVVVICIVLYSIVRFVKNHLVLSIKLKRS